MFILFVMDDGDVRPDVKERDFAEKYFSPILAPSNF